MTWFMFLSDLTTDGVCELWLGLFLSDLTTDGVCELWLGMFLSDLTTDGVCELWLGLCFWVILPLMGYVSYDLVYVSEWSYHWWGMWVMTWSMFLSDLTTDGVCELWLGLCFWVILPLMGYVSYDLVYVSEILLLWLLLTVIYQICSLQNSEKIIKKIYITCLGQEDLV